MHPQSSRGRKLPEIYFMGIIDILQEYNARKHAETAYKSLRHSKPEISCVDPVFYARRFTAFLEEHTD
jgi:1-phosphatidylinositol-4-phosphate 5-kinase